MKTENIFNKVSVSAIVIFCVAVQFCICGFAQAMDYAIGADLSFLKQAEDGGTVFKDNGEEKAGLAIFKEHGYNWIRLRLFHTPTRLPNNLEYTIVRACRTILNILLPWLSRPGNLALNSY